MSKSGKPEKAQNIFPTLEEQIDVRDKKRAKDGLDFILKYCEEKDLHLEADPRVRRVGNQLIIEAVPQVRALPLKAKKEPEKK